MSKVPHAPKASKKGHVPPQFLAHMKHKGEAKASAPHLPKALPPRGPMSVPPLSMSPAPEMPSGPNLGATTAIHKKHVAHAHSMIHGSPSHGH